LSIIANVFKCQTITCEKLGILTPFESVCFGYAFFLTCQYATYNEKVSSSLQHVSIKCAQSLIQACITWPKNQEKEGWNGKLFVWIYVCDHGS
jgi:hypothetical protein